MFTSYNWRLVCAFVVCASAILPGCSNNARVLKASHQWPDGDVRGELLEFIRRDLDSMDVGLQVRIYPGQSLFEATEQWAGMISGRLDISVFPLAYASGRHPEFNLTLMPGLIRNHDHAERINQSSYMQEIRRRIEAQGVVVLADAWLAGGFASKGGCIRSPEDVKGVTIRGAGKAFEQMLLGAGGSITSMPSSELYTAMQTGVLDAAMTSSISLISFRLYEQVTCLTAPGDTALWFMYEPILMSRDSFNSLTEQQREILMNSAKKAERFFSERTKQLDVEAEQAFRKAGVEVVHLSVDELEKWYELARETSHKLFREEVDGGELLLDQALSIK